MRLRVALVSTFLAFPALYNIDCDEGSILESPPPAPRYSSISGTVDLKDGGVAAGIDVRLTRIKYDPCMFCSVRNSRSYDVAEKAADENGQFEFTRLEPGSYVIYLGDYEGYARTGKQEEVTLVEEASATVSYTLVPAERR